VIAAETVPTFSYGVANPFTVNVWNAFFVSVALLFLAIWAVYHFAQIDVQTRFAPKKAN
jgi:formate-dependent nitrite reductase membrane component NrfD